MVFDAHAGLVAVSQVKKPTRITVIHDGADYNELRLIEAFTHWYNGGCCEGKVRELFEQVVKDRDLP